MAPPQSLKDTGLKATLPRLKILDLFQRSSERHLSAEEVYRMLIAEELDVGLATIYRVLTQFEQAGILRRHHFESGKAVFELDKGDHHDHIMCIDCGHVEEFYDPEIEARQSEVAMKMGFKVRDHAMYLYAECTRPNCPNRAAHKKGNSGAGD